MARTEDSKRPDLAALAQAAASGDKAAAQELLSALEDDVYGLSLRMLGHPADAEDAAQEILVVVLTHLGSFRGESSFRTWVWRIAAHHLSRVRRGRRETITFDVLDERLTTGLRDEDSERPDPEADALTHELRLRCTEAMLLSLDREHRIAYLLGDILQLSSDEAAAVLELEAATFRKRLARARERLYDFMRARCSVYRPGNPCRCERQFESAIDRGLIAPEDLYLSSQRTAAAPPALGRAAREVTDLMRVAEVIRGPASYLAPAKLTENLRELLSSQRLELLRS
jgi:RNA polymerase sigma factor (sigma-70 family)